MTAVDTAAVIGGGIAGLVSAIALRQVGIEATVYEAHADSAHGVGKLLLMAPNGMAALRCIDADRQVAETGPAIQRTVIENNTGRRLGSFVDLPDLPSSRMFNRGDLYQGLAELAAERGTRVEYGKRIVSFDDADPSGIVAHFDDGTSRTAGIVIGADGIRSTVRTLLDGNAPAPRYVGLLGFGSSVPRDGLRSTNGAIHYALGTRAPFAYHVGDEGDPVDRTGWFAGLPFAEPLSAAEADAVPGEVWLRRLKDLYTEDRIPALRMLDRIRGEDLVNIGRLEEMPRVPVWHRGRAVLVGDSAHAMSPSTGQGGSLAIEGAVQLARCLRDLPTVCEAFTAYEGLRRDRVEKVVAESAVVTGAQAASSRIGRLLRDLLAPIAIRSPKSREKSLGWIHRYTIDWDSRVSAVSP
ncbi:MAG: hypothetical protein QOC94_3598 [Actinoplanes sp.]|nr:hypothetical protein [Actinoplanes sp.]